MSGMYLVGSINNVVFFSKYSIPFEHDGFSSGHKDDVVVLPADFPERTANIYDEFVVSEHKAKKVHPAPRKHGYVVNKIKNSKEVYDSFAGVRDQKTEVEPVTLPNGAVGVYDGFVKTEKQHGSKHEKKHEKPHKEVKHDLDRWYDVGPITQFFLDLAGAEAPVHDSFTNGIEDKTIVEHLSDMPEPRAEVRDEFTLGYDDGDDSVYRAKRSSSPPSQENVVWKLVCVKRRPVSFLSA
jgi:hypothetical protein